MLKIVTIIIGVLFMSLAFLSIIPNPLIGKSALIATDFLHNLIHLLTGGLLIFVSIWNFNYLLKAFRILGYFFVSLAILGSWSTGFDIGKILGIILTNGIGNIFNLIVGVLFIVIGTNSIRDGKEAEEVLEH